ncbi:MAG: heme exporter protein CcmD [Candidatus Pacebacteria bacterium]|nr:heme exporter protein CcmD [Candidatus Paceibacterota bacterium]
MGNYFASFSDFITMTPYGAYIWSAYGIVMVVTLGLLVSSQIRLKRAIKKRGSP